MDPEGLEMGNDGEYMAPDGERVTVRVNENTPLVGSNRGDDGEYVEIPPDEAKDLRKDDLEIGWELGETERREAKTESVNSLDEEFGQVKVEHLKHVPPVNPQSGFWSKLTYIFIRRRTMKQFISEGVVYREKKKRKVYEDELFFDLVLVANCAVFGHQMREGYDGWPSVQKFFLLFQLVWFIWSMMTYKTNILGIETDFLGKYGMAAIIFALVSIGLSAHTSFSTTIRWTSGTAAGVISWLSIMLVVIGAMSTKIGSKNPFRNALMFYGLFNLASAFPYLVAFVVNTKAVAIAMYWTSFGLQCARTVGLVPIFMRTSQALGQKTYPAVSIEAFTERFGLLTLITLGESFISLLFESARVSSPRTVAPIIGVGSFGILISYGVMILYFDVDNKLQHGEMHACRYNANNGVLWTMLHLIYHSSLIAGASALGEALYVAAHEWTAGHEGVSEVGMPVFDMKWRWLLCAGYGLALILSAWMSALHRTGPYSVTKWTRITGRVLWASISLFVVIPLWGPEDSLSLVGYVMLVILVSGNVELFLVQADRLRLWPWVDYEERKDDPRLLDDLTHSRTSSISDSTSESLFHAISYVAHGFKSKGDVTH